MTIPEEVYSASEIRKSWTISSCPSAAFLSNDTFSNFVFFAPCMRYCFFFGDARLKQTIYTFALRRSAGLQTASQRASSTATRLSRPQISKHDRPPARLLASQVDSRKIKKGINSKRWTWVSLACEAMLYQTLKLFGIWGDGGKAPPLDWWRSRLTPPLRRRECKMEIIQL
jgi:hypothetical protein